MTTTAPCQPESVCGDMNGGSWMCGLDTRLSGALQPPRGTPQRAAPGWERGCTGHPMVPVGHRGWGTPNLSGLKEFGRNPAEYALSPPDTSN